MIRPDMIPAVNSLPTDTSPTVPMSEFNQFDPDFYVDITEKQEQKMEAIRRFSCQPQLGDFYVHFAKHRAFQARDKKLFPKSQEELCVLHKKVFLVIVQRLPTVTGARVWP
ncbi:MAG: hypothetical protein WBI82_10265 [Sphaerochaeta sp.]